MKTGSLADVILRSAAGWLSLSSTRRDRSRSSGPPLVDNPHSCSLGSALVVVCGAPSPPPPLPRALIRVRFCGAKSNSGCKAQGGWGGSAHYPDPTAQSVDRESRRARRMRPHVHGHGLEATVLLATVLRATVLRATVLWATVLWATVLWATVLWAT